MKITAGNLGPVPFAVQTALLDLGIEMILPPLSNHLSQELGEVHLKTELCHPLKVLLGNYLSIKDEKPEVALFYGGCDLCNIPRITDIFLEVFSQYGWFPETYFLSITKKNEFVRDYYRLLRKLTGLSRLRIIKAMWLGYSKYQLFDYLDKVFYSIRPVIKDYNTGESLYSYFFQKIAGATSFSAYRQIKYELGDLIKSYPPNSDLIHIGLVGDPYSLVEPYCHQYTDRKLGYMGVVTDRWLVNKLIKKKVVRNISTGEFIKNKYGVQTPLELKKINSYIQRGYDGLIFISPFSCNPCDALRNHLASIQEKSGIPILSLVFDSHTSPTGLQSRLEAYVDMVGRKKQKAVLN